MNYFEDHIGDYAAATAHLTWDEDMAYTRLIRAYYHAEKPIPKGQGYRLARATTPSQRKAVDAVLAEFFTLEEDGYHQKRCDEEIARYQDKQAKAKRSAQARWNAKPPHSDGNANASPDAMRTHSEGNALQSPDSSHQTPSLSDSERQSAFAACGAALKRAGISLATANTDNPIYRALVEQGMTPDELEAVAREAVEKRISKPLPWICTVVQDRRAKAASIKLAPKTSTQEAKPWDGAI